MITGRRIAAALFAAGMMVPVTIGSSIAAEQVTVTKNGTALRQAPTPTAHVEWKVNSGFPLTVVDERDGWMQVQSAQLPKGSGEFWVRSSQVNAVGGASTGAADASEKPIGYRVELTGTPHLKFKMDCRIVQDGRVSFRPHFNRLPRTYEFSADPVVCFAWKKQHYGTLNLTLVEVYPSRERVIGSVETRDDDFEISLVARTRGPDYPTDIFTHSDTPWGPEAVALTRTGSLYLPPSTTP